MKYIILLLAGMCLCYLCPAQEADSVLILDELKVQDTRLENFTIGEKIETVSDSHLTATEYSSLAELLAKYSGANIRSYGVSGLSTPSVRGTGSNHTAVFWEGVNLQSPTNGGLDLTLVPVSFVDRVSLQYGGAGSLFGSGTLGGAIHINTLQKQTEGFGGRIFQQVGSFGSIYTGLNLHLSHKKVKTGIRGFRNHADNDFSYYNRFTGRHEERQNAGIDQQGLLSEISVALNEANALSVKYWYQDNDVQIPRSASEGLASQASQADDFHRVLMRYDNQRGQRTVRLHTALISHKLKYNNGRGSISNNRSASWVSEFETSFKPGVHTWLDAGINHTYEQAEVDGYAGTNPTRNRTAIYASVKTLIAGNLEMALGIRESYNDNDFSPLMPSLGLNYALTRNIQLKGKAARSFRIPTFNDLYWKSAGAEGNPDLKPELGWSTEMGVAFDNKLDNSSLGMEATVFSNHIDQWIQWIPKGSSLWTPVNVEKVWARGVEVRGNYLFKVSDQFYCQLWGNYSYTRSTKEKINEGGNGQELGKQVIYTPLHQGKLSLEIFYQDIGFSYGYFLMGKQYVRGDNALALEEYGISDISLSYSFRLSERHQFTFLAKANNLFNKQYEVRNAWPMPGRNYHLTIAYEFN